MKKVIYVVGIVFLSLIIVLNLIFTANMNASEHVEVNYNYWIYTIGIVLLAIFIYYLTYVINKVLYNDNNIEFKKKIRKKLFIGSILIYVLFNIIWAITVNPKVVGDSVHVCNLAQTFYRGDNEEFLYNTTYAGISLFDYMQVYPQQVSLAFVFSMFFRLIHFDIMEVLRVLNIIGNIVIVFTLYKINELLSKKYKTNKVLLLTLILTFVSIPMLLTFIYGDTPSLALCLLAVYFMMRYRKTKLYRYPIVASIFTMIAYMMRMNSLIFIIATVIYLLLILFKELRDNKLKTNLISIGVIIAYVIISIFPASLIKNYYADKYDLDKNKTYPTISYILMAMEEGSRENGGYNEEIARPALENPQEVKEEYVKRVKERLKYFSENLGYTFNFYTMKLAAMWTENTYSAIMNNQVDGSWIENITKPLTFYQKALLIVTCLCSLIVLLQNRKNLFLEVLFLLTIFVGGFAFHILWEAKSRYIIPYIVVLIPIASIGINKVNIFGKVKKD